MTGQPRELSGHLDLVAYRVVPEALTNAHRHGVDEARVTVTYTAESVVLAVANAVREPSAGPPRNGHGLIGMRERAAAVGGELQVGPDGGGGFRVQLTLPTPGPTP